MGGTSRRGEHCVHPDRLMTFLLAAFNRGGLSRFMGTCERFFVVDFLKVSKHTCNLVIFVRSVCSTISSSLSNLVVSEAEAH